MKTNKGAHLTETISDVFGSKFVDKLTDVSFSTTEFNLKGMISKLDSGRSSSDRQFFYLNKRPVDLPKLCRAINEVYKIQNKKEYPVFVLTLELNSAAL